MSALRGPLSLLGRLMLCGIFVMSAAAVMIPHFRKTVELLETKGVPNTVIAGGYTQSEVMLGGAIVFLILGSLLIIIGYGARFGAFLLLVFLGLASYYFHRFWDMPDGLEKTNEMVQFMKNVALAGAMLLIMANGVGRWSMESKAEQPY